MDCLEVLHKLEVGIGNSLHVPELEVYLGVRSYLEIVFAAGRLGVELSKSQGRLAGIPNLSAVPPGLLVCPPVRPNLMQDLVLVDLDLSARLLVSRPDKGEVQLEYLGS